MDRPFFYGVIATFPSSKSAEGYLEFERRAVFRVVREGGAISGKVIVLTSHREKVMIETQYVFPDKRRLNSYLSSSLEAALREASTEQFGKTRVEFERRSGEIFPQSLPDE